MQKGMSSLKLVVYFNEVLLHRNCTKNI